MKNFAVEIIILNREYWQEREYKRQLEVLLENTKNQLLNTEDLAKSSRYLLNLEEEVSIEYEKLLKEKIELIKVQIEKVKLRSKCFRKTKRIFQSYCWKCFR